MIINNQAKKLAYYSENFQLSAALGTMASNARRAAEDGSRPDRRLATNPTREIISVASSTRSANERTR